MSNNGKIIFFDEEEFGKIDDSETLLIPLTAREASVLLSQVPYIQWSTRWKNLTKSQKQLMEISASIADGLMNPMTININDCEDVEDCIEVSESFLSLTGQVTSNQNGITSNTDQIQNNTNEIEEIENTTPKNEYPPAPTQSLEPDQLCASSWYIAREINSIIQDLIAGTVWGNILEFIDFFLTKGGFKYISLVELWNLFQANNNPSLSSECSDAIEHVAEAFYCAELDRQQATSDIQSDVNITTDAKTLYTAVIEAWTNSYFNLTAVVGMNNNGEDCDGFCGISCETFDFTIDDGGFEKFVLIGGQSFGVYTSLGWEDTVRASSGSRYISIRKSVSLNSVSSLIMTYDLDESVSGGNSSARAALLNNG